MELAPKPKHKYTNDGQSWWDNIYQYYINWQCQLAPHPKDKTSIPMMDNLGGNQSTQRNPREDRHALQQCKSLPIKILEKNFCANFCN